MSGSKDHPQDALEMTQSWHPDSYQENAGFVARLGADVLALLAPRSHERILDLGCGDGVLTEELTKYAAHVVGIDASAEQIAGARCKGLNAHVMDGADIRLDETFDAVFSNAALHWMTDPDAVIAGVKNVLKPGGRFVAEFGGAGNVERIRLAMEQALTDRGLDGPSLNPWYFPSCDDYTQRLKSAGFIVDSMELIDRPTELPGDVTGWLATFAENYLQAVPEEEQPALLAEVRAKLEPQSRREDGVWIADYVRLRFAAHLPEDV